MAANNNEQISKRKRKLEYIKLTVLTVKQSRQGKQKLDSKNIKRSEYIVKRLKDVNWVWHSINNHNTFNVNT